MYNPTGTTTSTTLADTTEKSKNSKNSKRAAGEEEPWLELEPESSDSDSSSQVSKESTDPNTEDNTPENFGKDFEFDFTPESGRQLVRPFIGIQTIPVRKNEAKFNLPVEQLPSGQSIQELSQNSSTFSERLFTDWIGFHEDHSIINICGYYYRIR